MPRRKVKSEERELTPEKKKKISLGFEEIFMGIVLSVFAVYVVIEVISILSNLGVIQQWNR